MKLRLRTVAASISGITCALLLIVIPRIINKSSQSFVIEVSDSEDDIAFSPTDFREGEPLSPGARASPEEVDAIYNSVEKEVSGLESRVNVLKKTITGNEEVNIVLGSRGPPGPEILCSFPCS